MVFGPFTPQIEEWRGRDLSSFLGNEKLQIFMLALVQKTVIGPFFEARAGINKGRGPGLGAGGAGPGGCCPLLRARCVVPGVWYPVLGARCPLPGARCPVLGARCPAPGARCPVPGARSSNRPIGR